MTVGIYLVLLLSYVWFWRRTADLNSRRAGFALFLPTLFFYSLYAMGRCGVGIPSLLLLLSGGD